MMSKSNISRLKRLATEGMLIGGGQVAVLFGALFGIRLLTELLSPAAYGELGLGITIATLCNQVVFGPVQHGITRFYSPAAAANEMVGYFSAATRLIQNATLLVAVITFFVVITLLGLGQEKLISIFVAAALWSIFSGYNSIVTGVNNAARRRSIVVMHQVAEMWGRYLIAGTLIILTSPSSAVVLAGYALAATLVFISQYRSIRKKIPPGINKESEDLWRSEILKYSWPFTTWGIFTWAQLVSDRWALQLSSAADSVGLFQVLFQLGSFPMVMATGAMIQLISPILYQKAGNAKDKNRTAEVNNLGWLLTALVVAMTLVIFYFVQQFHSEIFKFFVAIEYQSVSYLLPWMVLAGGIFAASQTVSANLMSQMKTQNMIRAKIVTSVFGLILNFAGAYYWGLIGVVGAAVIFSIVHFIWLSLLAQAKK